MTARQGPHPAASGDAKRAMDEWAEANGKQARDLAAAAIQETSTSLVRYEEERTPAQSATQPSEDSLIPDICGAY